MICPRGEMDIITGFEPVVVGSSPAEGTLKFINTNIKIIYQYQYL